MIVFLQIRIQAIQEGLLRVGQISLHILANY